MPNVWRPFGAHASIEMSCCGDPVMVVRRLATPLPPRSVKCQKQIRQEVKTMKKYSKPTVESVSKSTMLRDNA
ncbi:hypothetical protein ACH4OY_29895 [Micromonospora rubida]|uniref:Uncharacterized protein n=1 Tax=Micromonospora rubida TaxID=2697657 RepID=A0ABW7SX48_9ACTN